VKSRSAVPLPAGAAVESRFDIPCPPTRSGENREERELERRHDRAAVQVWSA